MRRATRAALAALAFLAAAYSGPAAESASGEFAGELRMTLWKGLFQGSTPGERPAHLILHLETCDGRWGRVWGMALGYNNGVHHGVVREGTFFSGGTVRLHVGMVIEEDPWTPGGMAAYTIDLKREAGGTFEGTFHGTFKGREVSGKASGRVKPPRPIRVEGFRPAGPQEHPRLLLRKSDLPRLREKLKTPFGQAFFEKARASGDLISLGLLYQLTGETPYADRAAAVVRGFEGDLAANGFGSGGFGHRLVSVCMAYDLCFDAWPDDLKTEVEAFLLDIIPRQQRHILISHANYHPCCNYYGPGRAVPALASLVLWGAKGPPPEKPPDPTGRAKALEPDTDYTPPKGVPVVDFEPGATGGGDLAVRRAAYDLDLAIWRAEHEAWERSGGLDQARQRFVDLGYQQVSWHYRLGIGDGGFQAETGGYAGIASWYPLVYATAHVTMFGRDASPYPDVAHLMPRRMMQVLFRPDGTQTAQKLNSVVGIDAPWCAAAFPIVPQEYKPALLWAWNHVTGVTGEGSKAKALPDRNEGGRNSLALAHTFLHYPLEMKPVHPREVMPLAWEAPTFGYHCFRSGWEGSDEFIGQVFLKAAPVGGWNHPNAGTFRLFGLGHEWVTGPTSRNGVREQENVVLLPEDEINESSCGRPAYRKTEADGSAVLTIDLGDVYARKSSLYDRNLIRWPERLVESGITGLRAVAFDYSGAGGAPAMMVLVDRIRGGGKKVWLWQVPKEWMSKVTIRGNTFVLDHGDASMTATFVAPENVTLEAVTETIQVRDARHGYHGEVSRIKATGGDDFFVVLTFQRTAPPRVQVEGKGLEAVVTVGRRRVRFDGGPPSRIVLSPPE